MKIKIKGHIVLVDKSDYERISKHSWSVSENKSGQIYFLAWVGKEKKSLHRMVSNAPKGFFVDHKNGNTLDNRKTNLRLCTNAQNQQNQKIKIGGSSKYKGVYFNKRDKGFYARIRSFGKQYHLGFFKNEKDAARAYNKKAKELNGEFAKINEGI